MQYMRVVQAGGGQSQQQQVINLRGATPILPSTAAAAPASKARAKSTLSGVKISVPPGGLAKGANVTLAGNYKVYQNRVLLPQGESLPIKQEVRNENSVHVEHNESALLPVKNCQRKSYRIFPLGLELKTLSNLSNVTSLTLTVCC